MTYVQAQMKEAPEAPSLRLSWFSRWVVRRWIVYCIVVGDYLARVLSTGRLTLVDFLLLTAMYGAWLVIFRPLGWPDKHPPLWRLFALVCLACATQFLPLSSLDLNWLPILPTATACLVIANSSRYLGLIASGVLWLSSSLAFILIMRGWDLAAQLILLLTFGSFVGLSVTIRELVLAHKALEHSSAELAVAHTKLQEYSAQVEEIGAIRERNRIAREIHDTLGHSLTLLAVQLETATQFEARGEPGLHEELLEARRVAKACLMDVRHSVEALRPDDASGASFQNRLRRLVAGFATTCRETAITLDLEEMTQSLSPEIAMTLYRCAQEALTNIRKHAGATKALLYLSTSDGPEKEGQVELSVLDNGQGATAGSDEQAPGFGLLGMRERVTLLGGTMRAGPEPGHGWRVAVVIPSKQRGPAEIIVQRAHETRGRRSL
jgi:signal transduction histidine kinase